MKWKKAKSCARWNKDVGFLGAPIARWEAVVVNIIKWMKRIIRIGDDLASKNVLSLSDAVEKIYWRFIRRIATVSQI